MPRQFVQRWLAENVNADAIHTYGEFDTNTPAIVTRQLLNFAKDAGFPEDQIRSSQPNLEMEVAQAIMRVVEQHKDEGHRK